MKNTELKVGQSFYVYQNNKGCISGLHNFIDGKYIAYFRDINCNVYYFGEKMNKVAKLTITKLK